MLFTKVPLALPVLLLAALALVLTEETAHAQHRNCGCPPHGPTGPSVARPPAGPLPGQPPLAPPASGGRLPAVSLPPAHVHSQLQQLCAIPRQQLASLSPLQLSAMMQQLTLVQQQQLTPLQQYQLNVLLQQLNGLLQQQYLQAQQLQFQQLNARR